MFIYKTTNLINGKIYIGQSCKNLNEEYFGSGLFLKKSIKKYGVENFIREIIQYCNNKQELNIQERYWIQYYDSLNQDIGYNLALGGQGGHITPSDKLSKCVKEKQWTGEVGELRRKQMSIKFKGCNNSSSKKYKIIDNDGNEFIVDCFAEFCEKYNLKISTARSHIDKGKIIKKNNKDNSFFHCKTKQLLENWEIISLDKNRNKHTQKTKQYLKKINQTRLYNKLKSQVIYNSGEVEIFNTKKELLENIPGMTDYKFQQMTKFNKTYNFDFKIILL